MGAQARLHGMHALPTIYTVASSEADAYIACSRRLSPAQTRRHAVADFTRSMRWMTVAGCAAAVGAIVTACGGDAFDPEMPREVKLQWFGYTNYHVQMGKVGLLMDAAYTFGKQANNPTLVDRVLSALKQGGATIDYMVLEHNHGDHSVNMPQVQKATGAKYYAMAAGCTTAGQQGAACEPVKGGEIIPLSKYVTAYPFRFIHGIECGDPMAANGGTETIAWLFVVQTTGGNVAFVLTGSGVGGPDAMKEVVIDGQNLGSADGNFKKAMAAAGITKLDLQTIGPEQRYATQAATWLPQWGAKVLFQTHVAAGTGLVDGVQRRYDLLEGLHYQFRLEDSPQLTGLLKKFPGTQYVAPGNYFDAWTITTTGFQPAGNALTKQAMGLPASGPGPLPQSPVNFRSRPVGDPDGIDCPADEFLFK